jgi:peptidase E
MNERSSAAAPPRTIIALGGGGFSEASEPELDVYVLERSPAARPRIGFIGTASGDSERYLVKFYERFAALKCQPGHLPLFRRTPDLAQWVAAQDILYVGGGNTRSMLALWQAWGLAPLLAAAAARGTVLAGVSAGAVCWFEHAITDSHANSLTSLAGLGLLAGSCCPHYSNELERQPAYHRLIAAGSVPAGIGIDDGAAAHFDNGRLQRIVVARKQASVHQVRALAGEISVQPAAVETVTLV